MIVPLRLLAVAACFHSISLSGRPVFLGLGHPRKLFQMESIQAATVLIMIYPLASAKGATGAAGAMVVSSLAMLFFWYIHVTKLVDLTLKDLGQVFGPPLIATATMSPLLILSSFRARESPEMASEMLWFVGLLSAGLITYLLTLRLVEPLFPNNQPLKAFGILLRS